MRQERKAGGADSSFARLLIYVAFITFSWFGRGRYGGLWGAGLGWCGAGLVRGWGGAGQGRLPGAMAGRTGCWAVGLGGEFPASGRMVVASW